MIWFPFKTKLKRWVTRHHLAYVRRFRAFTPEDFSSLVGSLGVRRGDCLFVHSSLDQFAGFTGRPIDIIRILQEAVGREGVLAMPTNPFSGTAVDWVERGEIFDVRRTPSRVGLLTELFRRMPDVHRSVHPTHAVAAWGDRAADFVQGHYNATTPCGLGSPFAKLGELDGKILLLGTGKEYPLTFYHRVEEEIEGLMPFTPFTGEIHVLMAKDLMGRYVETRTRLFDPDVSRRRNMRKLVTRLEAQGKWRRERIRGLEASLCHAGDVAQVSRAMAERGEFCYDLDV